MAATFPDQRFNIDHSFVVTDAATGAKVATFPEQYFNVSIDTLLFLEAQAIAELERLNKSSAAKYGNKRKP